MIFSSSSLIGGLLIFLYLCLNILSKLHIVELFIQTAFSQQFIMSALLYNFALFNNNDSISMLHRGETMGNDKGGPVFHKSLQGLLHLCFRLGIKRGSR